MGVVCRYHALMNFRAALRLADRRPRTLLIIVLVTSRVIFYACGVRFDAAWLGDMWQLVDPHLLQTRLGESLYFLHGQPPLFNTFVGVMLKLGGGGGAHYAALGAAIYRLLGLAMVLMLLEVMLRCGVRARLALLLAVLFAI